MKTDGKLDRNWLNGALGDVIHAVLYGAGYNMRMILRKLRFFTPSLSSRCSPVLLPPSQQYDLNDRQSELFRGDEVASFGGLKQSGIGSEGSHCGIEAYAVVYMCMSGIH
jgi:hypothetical protein